MCYFKYNKIESETEKAVKLNVAVQWGDGKWHEKLMWFPKSQITLDKVHETAQLADWFYSKLSKENMFHGYMMYFAMEF